MDELNIENAVCAGGACVILNNKVEHEEYFPKDEIRNIFNECRKNNIVMISVGESMCYTADKSFKIKLYSFIMKIYSKSKHFRVGSVQSNDGSNFTCIKQLNEFEFLNIPTQKLLFLNCRSIGRVHSLKRYNIYNETLWKTIEFDFKEKGIEYIRKKFNIQLHDIVVFGDGPNDISMFRYADNSIAMGNSCSQIKELASFITKNSHEDGIEYACRYFGWI